MKCLILLVGLLLSPAACAKDYKLPLRPKLPYPSWHIGLAAPKHMEVWVEDVDVLDQRGLAFFHVFGGVASYTGKVKGWHQGGGASKPATYVDLPDQIYLRWQSLAEPQTYMINIPIPQWVRDTMLKQEKIFCAFDGNDVTVYRNRITLGMAPGGIVKVWVGDGCLGHLEVGRFEAKIDPRGPYIGLSKGKYIKMEPENKEYVEKHGVPYGSW